ncbi:hypothetical protein DV737_g1692, partial [Chaetothyriales sp. CBS 132003]
MAKSGDEQQLPAETHFMSPPTGSGASSPGEQAPAAAKIADLEKAETQNTHRSARSQGPAQRITTAQDWTGPDDPGNPLIWSMGWKAYTMAMISLQAFTSTFGSSVISPGAREIAQRFRVSTTAAILPLSLYVIGLALGPVISAPLSETYGRRAVYLLLFPPSLLFTLGAGLSQSLGSLLVCRLLAGTFCSGCLAVGAGSMSDIWAPKHRAAAGAIFLLVPFLGPALGPSVGGYVVQEKGWRWTQWSILFLGAFTYLVALPQRETYKKIILQQRAKKFNLPPPPNTIPSGFARMKFFLTVSLFRPLHMIFTEPIVSFLSVYTAFNFAVLFCFFAAFPIVYESPYPDIQIYHFSTGEAGLVFLGLGIGNLIATAGSIVLDRMTYQKKFAQRAANGGDSTRPLPPEERLISAKIGSFLLPVSLFWFAWTARPHIHWIVPTLATVPFAIGNLLVFASTMLYLVDTYGPLGGASAAAANGILRYIAGAVFPLFTVQMYRAMGVSWATSLLAFVTVALLPIPWALAVYGPKIRGRSAYTLTGNHK